MKNIIAILLLALLMNTKQAYASNASVLLSLYGYDKAVSPDQEERKLLDITQAYNSVNTKIKNDEMMEEAISIYSSKYEDILTDYDHRILQLQQKLHKQSKKIYDNRHDSVEYLLELDATYQSFLITLLEIQSERAILTGQPDKLSTNSEETARMRQEYTKLEKKLEQQEEKYEKATGYPELGDVRNLSYPLSEASSVTSGFGQREDPFNRDNLQFHNGLDLSASMNTNVTSLFHGTVETVGESETIGFYIIINHGKGIKTLYGHLDYYNVEEEQEVNQYDVIGSSGNSGSRSTGPHLHIGLYINGVAVDPSRVFK